MASKKVGTFLVKGRRAADGEDAPMLLKGTRSQVEGYILGVHTIEPATDAQLVECGRTGIEIIDASTAG